ncbi:hypothetical protein [Streptomyces hiroshimensis]|uniref:Uncharacterized protein n=1 Tax=Streptomyces hiroshimensis TaxID=66424 RepID=A0ABQ2Z5N7_9ACTN|nr:hypothetical protein [Streptomyces hiroshimensis]GGY05336.1 hypothetical protein GCM10010324_60160 [Streptomyces hiroshimensis]
MTTGKAVTAWKDDDPAPGRRLELTADQNAAVTGRWEAARAAHKGLDAVMEEVQQALADSHGAKLEGKQHRLMGLKAFRRKAAMELDDRVPLEKVVRKVQDLNRYTLVFDVKAYTEGVRHTYALLHERGYVIVPDSERNTWEDPVHKGFRAAWQRPDGTVTFEIAFHTPDSHWAKTENRLLYDLYRSSRLRPPGEEPENTAESHEEAAKVVQHRRYSEIPAKGSK